MSKSQPKSSNDIAQTQGTRSTNAPRPNTNPLKNENQSKETTREGSDHSRPSGPGPGTRDSVTGQGGSTSKGNHNPPNTAHPAEQGGAVMTEHNKGGEQSPRPGEKRNGPSPADETSSDRTGTAPDRSGGPSRTGSRGTQGNRRN